MRLSRPLAAAALLLLALGAAGCKPSSLAPLWIDYQDYGDGGANINGLWAGTTSTAGEVSFEIGDDTVTRPRFQHLSDGCTLTFEDTSIEAIVIDGTFTLEIPLDQGTFVATGNFSSATACSGTYFFEDLPAGNCPSDGTGTFSAEKTR